MTSRAGQIKQSAVTYAEAEVALTSSLTAQSRWAGLSLYTAVRELQYLITTWLDTCALCEQAVPNRTKHY